MIFCDHGNFVFSRQRVNGVQHEPLIKIADRTFTIEDQSLLLGDLAFLDATALGWRNINV